MVAFPLEPVLIDGQGPGHIPASDPIPVGTGCTMPVYHIRKGGGEDAAAKKKIVPVGAAVYMIMIALEMPNLLNML